METNFNYNLCEERHERIDDSMKVLFRGLEKVSNRFILFLTLLSLNLLGVIGILFSLLYR